MGEFIIGKQINQRDLHWEFELIKDALLIMGVGFLGNTISCFSPKISISKKILSRMLRDSTPHFVGPLVRPSVRLSVHPSIRPSHFTFFGFLRFLALLLLPKKSGDLNYGPCPPARDWSSHVSSLVWGNIALKNLQNLSHNMFCKNVACLVVAREHMVVKHSYTP